MKELELAMKLESEDKTDRAIDVICNFCLDSLEAGDLAAVDAILKEADLQKLSITLMVSLLSFTFIAADRIPYRQQFFESVKDEIIKREGNKRVKSLIGGLEGRKAKDARSAISLLMGSPKNEKKVDKPQPKREMMEVIVEQLSVAPDGQVAEHIRKDCEEAHKNIQKYSDAQLFDFINNIAKTSCCGTSSFVKTLCALDEFYTKPDES